MPKKALSDIKDPSLAKQGRRKIEWAGQNMPVLRFITDEFKKKKPLKGIRIAACLHVTTETANLMLTLVAGGATVSLCASNPLSTQDDTAASLVKDYGIAVYAIHGEDSKTYYRHLNQALDIHPELTYDDGADLVSLLHTKRKEQLSEIIGSSEETTTGVIRLRAMAADGELKLPVIAVNDSDTKHFFDNRYGTGQSSIDGILRATNTLLAGKRVVVGGYGWCGRGIASRMRGMGAHVTVLEVDPIKALEAVMDGFSVDKIARAARYGDIFVTATGDKEVISLKHMLSMKDGAIVANSGHFNVELDYAGVVKKAKSRKVIRDSLEEFVMPSGKKLYVLGEGRLVNLAAAEGHPAEVMDMSFANQALAATWLLQRKESLRPRVYTLPKYIDQRVARLKLRAMGVRFDRLTPLQRKYLRTWTEGT